MPQWQLLSLFNTVAEEGSFSGAAKRLALTQPTVSFHIDNLEKIFGCPLFQRTARGVALTDYGKLLFDHTRKIDNQIKLAHQQIQHMLRGEAGELVIGASTIPAEYILPGLIAGFLRDRPGLRFSLQTGTSDTILTRFAAGDFPLAIVGIPPGDEYPTLDLWPDEMVLVAHPDLRSSLGEHPTLETVLAYPFVTRPASSGSRQAVGRALKEHGLSPDRLRIVLEAGGNEALKAAVINRVGLGYISRWAVQDELQAGRLAVVQIPRFRITRHFYAVHQAAPLLNCCQSFWNFLAGRAITTTGQ